MQAYGINYTKDMTGRIAAKLELPGKKLSKEKGTSIKVKGDDSVTREKINQTLCELLQAGLVVPVHESNFRSKQDNRAEAERRVGKLAEYKIKGKSKKEIDALWEAEVRAHLHQWKHGSKDERSEIEAFKVGKKRALEESEEFSAEKRQRLYLATSEQTISSTGGGESKLTFNDLLKV